MKLYLSSFRIGSKAAELQTLVGTNKRTAVIANAADYKTPDERREKVAAEIADLQQLGFHPHELDLRDYFGKPQLLETDLAAYGLLWVRGGNVFTLRKAMTLSGFDTVIGTLLSQGVVYAGYSAGSCVTGPTLHGLELCDPLDVIPEGYPAEPIWKGLQLIDYTIIPHYRSEHPESPIIDNVVTYYDQHQLPYKPLRDGEVITVNT